MRIIPISEGTFTIDKTKLFVPFDEAKDNMEERPAGSLMVEVQPFVIITSKDILLLDTGLGFEKNGVLQLHQNLVDNGINPSEVTKVLLSHLHKDHAGAVGIEREGLGGRLSLPNAKYYVQRTELAYAFEKGSPSFITEELVCLRNSEQVELLEGDGTIDDYIQYQVTRAHSPHHQVYWIREGNETIFFGADDAPQLHQMKHRFVAKYDFDGKKAMELRQQWWEQGEKEKWTFLFYHDVKNPVWKF
ncbi:MAG TPA: MBL fold metallo-hydrolase [Chitinophagaceae bacterium]|jgi:glyoxylase-like metal-dependent hydrolase (beta-lactamase superfamily II)|nr:MBL fold metallo-hydrolase [Chitinophagaceae bacterium]